MSKKRPLFHFNEVHLLWLECKTEIRKFLSEQPQETRLSRDEIENTLPAIAFFPYSSSVEWKKTRAFWRECLGTLYEKDPDTVLGILQILRRHLKPENKPKSNRAALRRYLLWFPQIEIRPGRTAPINRATHKEIALAFEREFHYSVSAEDVRQAWNEVTALEEEDALEFLSHIESNAKLCRMTLGEYIEEGLRQGLLELERMARAGIDLRKYFNDQPLGNPPNLARLKVLEECGYLEWTE